MHLEPGMNNNVVDTFYALGKSTCEDGPLLFCHEGLTIIRAEIIKSC